MTTPESNDILTSQAVDTSSAGELRSHSVSSAALFRGQREIVIVHRGQEYRLRITKSDKLILTK